MLHITRMHTHTHVHTHAHTHMYTHAHTLVHITYTHTRVRIHAHTCLQIWPVWILKCKSSIGPSPLSTNGWRTVKGCYPPSPQSWKGTLSLIEESRHSSTRYMLLMIFMTRDKFLCRKYGCTVVFLLVSASSYLHT